jgi:anti-anti-sigma regulatory factor
MNLKGNFDGSSAQVLLEALRRNCDDNQLISVDTDGLKHIHSFGRNVLQSHLEELKKKPVEIVFTGQKREALTAEWS